MSNQKAAENYYLLNNYKINNIEEPKVILRKLCNSASNDLNQDDLFVITLDMKNPDENIQKMLPAGFAWALDGLKKFKASYQKILADQTERVHLEGIAKQNSYLIIENIAPNENSNANDSSAYAGGCAELNGRPCIMLVADKISNTTLLHEAVHHSDLMLGGRPFSDLPIYQTIIMMIDAQISSSGSNNKTVQSLRKVNKLYKSGQLYVEGLAWISEMPMTDLYTEKNHLGQSLKLLHSAYTKALIENKPALLDCIEFFKPSAHLQPLLEEYNKNAQKITNNRAKILKQQQNFSNELLKFRKEIGSIERSGLGEQKLPVGTMAFCEACGFQSLTPAITAYHKAGTLFDQTKGDYGSVLTTLEQLQSAISKKDLATPSLVGKDFLTAYFYMQLAEHWPNAVKDDLVLAEIPESVKQKNADEIRTKVYEGMNKNLSMMMLAYQTGCSKHDCELAMRLKTTPEYVKATRQIVEREFANMGNLTQKTNAAYSLIADFEANPDEKAVKQAQLKAALAMETLLGEAFSNPHIHGALTRADIQSFDISKKILKDMQYLKTDENTDGLPLDSYQNFDLGIIADLCNRKPSCFNKESPDYIPNSFKSNTKTGTAYAQALYELLSLRYAWYPSIPPSLAMASFKPSADFYLKKLQREQNRLNGNTYASATLMKKLRQKHRS